MGTHGWKVGQDPKSTQHRAFNQHMFKTQTQWETDSRNYRMQGTHFALVKLFGGEGELLEARSFAGHEVPRRHWLPVSRARPRGGVEGSVCEAARSQPGVRPPSVGWRGSSHLTSVTRQKKSGVAPVLPQTIALRSAPDAVIVVDVHEQRL